MQKIDFFQSLNIINIFNSQTLEIKQNKLIYTCENWLENMHKSMVSCCWYVEHAKMSEETGSYWVPSPSRWGTGRADGHVLQVFPKEFLSVIESSKVLSRKIGK